MKQITKAELKQALREVLIEMGFTNTTPIRKPRKPAQQKDELGEWETTARAWKAIGYSSAEELRKYTRSGFFQYGIDYTDGRLPGREKTSYKFHIENCKKKWKVLPEKRKTYKRKSAA